VASSVSDESDRSPVIGLSTYVEPARWGNWGEPAALLPHSYVSAINRVGATPVLLPPCPRLPRALLGLLDGLIITGGPDVDPGRYGAEAHPKTGRPRTERDEWELALAEAALDADLPLLAICRGLQVLNVALGGSLVQHLPDLVGHESHQPAPGQMGTTDVSLEPGNVFALILGPASRVLCHHHQAIERLGRGLRVVGHAADGTIEAVEVEGRAFALGVQWHPEDDAADDRLFAALADAARAYRRAPSNLAAQR
jgi:gamma-glutamyl-gamma-aminobutyrate hydrolase PuuD